MIKSYNQKGHKHFIYIDRLAGDQSVIGRKTKRKKFKRNNRHKQNLSKKVNELLIKQPIVIPWYKRLYQKLILLFY